MSARPRRNEAAPAAEGATVARHSRYDPQAAAGRSLHALSCAFRRALHMRMRITEPSHAHVSERVSVGEGGRTGAIPFREGKE